MQAEEIRKWKFHELAIKTQTACVLAEIAAQLAEIREEIKTGNICLLNIAERFDDFFKSEPVFADREMTSRGTTREGK